MDRNLLSSVSLYEEQIRKAEHMHDNYLEKINEYELKLKATKCLIKSLKEDIEELQKQ
jgi:peptidoglycan hydrolase CwlO-like protein